MQAERSSADKMMRTPISKQRNKHIQQVLVEAARLAPRYSDELALLYERERQRGNANRATLAVATTSKSTTCKALFRKCKMRYRPNPEPTQVRLWGLILRNARNRLSMSALPCSHSLRMRPQRISHHKPTSRYKCSPRRAGWVLIPTSPRPAVSASKSESSTLSSKRTAHLIRRR